jgi:Zn-dependent peptidase ImmA (M78 family)
MTYENLIIEAEKEGIEVYEHKFNTTRLKGLCTDNVITINSSVKTETEKKCVLAEELGHYYTSYGCILDRKDMRNLKQEKKAMGWAYEKLVPLEKFVAAYKAGVRNRYELSEFLDVIEEFLEESIKYYKAKYGICVKCDEYIIYFEPLSILKIFKEF